MKEEMLALQHNETWKLASLPPNKKAIGYKWVYTFKMNLDGSIARLRAHLVAKGYGSTYGVDYTNTFSLVANLSFVFVYLPSYH